LAEDAMASLLRDFREEADGCTSFHFSIDPVGGSVVSPVRDAYAHAFILLSIAALYGLNGERRLLDLAERTVRFIDRRLADPAHGGLFDAIPASTRDKRQNPHMHLLEAYLLLERAAPGHGYIERAVDLVALFDRHMFKADQRTLLEYFEADWSPHSDPARAEIFEPGHHFEWVWLLDQYADLSGTDVAHWSSPLFETAAHHGISEAGLIHDEVAAGSLEALKHSHRVWPHTEAIKAAVSRHRAGDPNAAALADAMATRLLKYFLDRPFSGGWVDHIDPAGTPLVDYVPASSLYHLFLASAEADAAFHSASPAQQTLKRSN
jgi:mannose-6-phosphate isomerase